MGGAPAGSSRAYRLDPHSVRARPSPTTADTRGFTIDVAQAAVMNCIPGEPALLVPFTAYSGVAVRMEATREPGRVRVYLELLHADPRLTVPLSIADDPDGIVADWQEWGRIVGLPLLVVAPDGTISTPLATLGCLTVFPPKLRRRPAHFRARRPRFLVRRKTGRSSGNGRIGGREIIARH
jgi:hypothetical protein